MNKLLYQPVPLAVYDSAPLTIFDPHQLVIEAEVLSEFFEQIDAESSAALEDLGVVVVHLLGDVDAFELGIVDHLTQDALIRFTRRRGTAKMGTSKSVICQ